MKTLIMVAIVALVFGFGLGFLVSQQSSGNQLTNILNPSIPVNSINGVYNVMGTIKQIQGDVITIDTGFATSSKNPLPIIKITVGPQTQIVMNRPKDKAVYVAELQTYQRMFTTSTPSTPPQSFTEKVLGLGDLKVDDMILAEANTDIKTAVSFTATRIIIQATAATASSSAILPPVIPAK